MEKEDSFNLRPVICKDKHWYDIILGVALIIFAIGYLILAILFHGFGILAVLSFFLLLFLCAIGIDLIGSYFFRQITLSEDVVVYRNCFGKETKADWDRVHVEFKPKSHKRAERFEFQFEGVSWVFNDECQNYVEMKKFLFHLGLKSFGENMKYADSAELVENKIKLS